MAHKRKEKEAKKSAPYTLEDAMKVTDDLFTLSQEKKYNVGAFTHGLVFALEYLQQMYNIPQQQLADIRRDCRKYVKKISSAQDNKEA
ncbi:MAG: hypothetical protein JW771_07565 [Candidatus Thermoplasmatota archaeon]|nr:hypothetical protein [Candidatus Thermoplasmatota archaeon]